MSIGSMILVVIVSIFVLVLGLVLGGAIALTGLKKRTNLDAISTQLFYILKILHYNSGDLTAEEGDLIEDHTYEALSIVEDTKNSLRKPKDI